VVAWVTAEYGRTYKSQGAPKETTINKVPAKVYEWSGLDDTGEGGWIKAWSWKLHESVDVAFVVVYPGEAKKAAKWEGPFDQMAKSFAPVAVKELASATPAGDDVRSKKRAELEKQVAPFGGKWKLYETRNYFVLVQQEKPETTQKDKEFVKELLERLEAIRREFEIDYPFEKAAELRKAGEGLQTGSDAEKRERKGEAEFAKRILGDVDPRELSRCSVVRVCSDEAAYATYGGPPGSAGYWYWPAQELVLYDTIEDDGRNGTWLVLNHEAFHQYIFYLYGNISPQSWYNEGTGDYYSGYKWYGGRFEQAKAVWRVETIRELIRDNRFVPLTDLVRFTQQEYYGQNKYGAGIGQNYAQGWSFIYFLRTGKKKGAKDWNADWDKILDTYFKTLAMTGNENQAVEDAFRGIDMEALTESWKDYIVSK
jgi:hypothetical protein